MLSFTINGQVDTLFWNNGSIKEIHFYSEVDKYEVEAYHPNGQLHFKGNVELWSNLEYRPNIETAFDKEGIQTIIDGNGTLYCYYENLNTMSIAHFNKNTLNAEYEEYFPSGKIKIKGNYGGTNSQYANYKKGIWKFYDENGQLFEERKYVNSNEYYLNFWIDGKQILKEGNGRLKMYYDSGLIKAEGSIKDGKKWGKWTEYSPSSKILNIIEYTNWGENYRSEINFKLNLVSVFDTNQISIGENGKGYMLTFRNDGTLESKTHYIDNSEDSIFTFYRNGTLFKKIKFDKWYETTVESYFPNQILAFKRINENESKYWDWNGNLISEVKQIDIENNSNAYKEITTKYYINGFTQEVQQCIISSVTNEFGEELFEYDCKNKYWDVEGNEINKP